MKNVVAIVGRPNVGKSTFFNRLLERREAIVDELSGVTRDRHYGCSAWNGKAFSVIDTGGYVAGSRDAFESAICEQVMLALAEACAIVFVVDVTTGVTEADREVAELLRPVDKPVFLMVNKADNPRRIADATVFYALGLGGYYTVSAMTGSGTGELLDELVKGFKAETHDELDERPSVAVVGRPNAGKSAFINALLGTDRNIVTDVAGTTRDALETPYNLYHHNFLLIDTAGLRKKAKVRADIEFYAALRSLRAISHSDVCLLLLDAQQGMQAQDLSIFRRIVENRKGVVILVNKWDLIEKDNYSLQSYSDSIKRRIAPFDDVPLVFISARHKQRIYRAIERAMAVFENRRRRIKTSRLNEVMQPVVKQTPPPAVKGKHVKIKYCTQLPTQAPQFAFFANAPQYVKEPYKRFLENQIRKHFDFSGVPLQLYLRKK